MAATGKKSKKAKWIKANLTDIIAEPTTIPTSNNWAASVDEENEGGFGYERRTRAPVVLPSASRAARGGLAVDDESIPRRPPFIAHISNLPYDVDETAITELFTGLKITNLRLPREGDRLKGFGYVDFEDRESLVSAMNIADLTISGRRIRIEVSTHDNDRRMGRGGRSDREREYDPERTMGDWRSGPRAVPDSSARPRPERPERPERAERPERDRDSSADNKPGAWRDAERPAADPPRAPYGGRDSYGRDRDRDGARDRYGDGARDRGYGGRDGFRAADRDGFRAADRDGFGSRESRGFGSRGFGDRDRDRDPPPPREESKPRERPKLNLVPRSVPRDEAEAERPQPAPAVFGAAKPVDTAAKEREIEERLRKQEEEARRAAEEKERWGARRTADHSGDRRSGARRDERGRDARPAYTRERRDYSKDDKDRRNDRDRRDHSRDRRDPSRDRRDPSRDRRDQSRDRRDNSRERREHSHSRRSSSRERAAQDRPVSRSRRSPSPPPAPEREREPDRNGERARADDDDRPLPKLKEQEKPNFVASNKFSFLEEADDAGSD